MKTIVLNGYEYLVEDDDFIIKPHQEYNNLKIYPKVGELERIVGLLNDLGENKSNITLLVKGWTDGGFIPINCAKSYTNVIVQSNKDIINNNLAANIEFNKSVEQPFAVFVNENEEIFNEEYLQSYILCNSKNVFKLKDFMSFKLDETNLTLNVPIDKFNEFYNNFWYYFDESRNFKYDNLIHLCIMVKNAGPLFEKVLTENL